MSATSSASVAIITAPSVISGLNRGPITSLFVAPSSCTATISYTNGAYYVGHWGGNYFAPSCYPTGSSGPAKPDSNWGQYYYSPAICPGGWSVATQFSNFVPVYPSPTFYTLGPATTAAVCCPSSYSYSELGHICASTVSKDQDILVLSYENLGDKFTSSFISQRQFSSTWVGCDGIPILWQASDSAALARASTMTPTPQVTTGTIPITPTASPSNTDTPSPPPGGLSTGTKIGLGVGIPLAVIALLAIGFLFWKRRQRPQPLPEHDTPHAANYKDVPVAQGYSAPGFGMEHNYQHGQAHYETQPDADGRYHRHELPVAHQ